MKGIRAMHPSAHFRRILFIIICFFATWAGFGAPLGIPLPTLAPSSTRHAILRMAESYLGTPYVYGGATAKGLDCSGYVYVVFLEATGHRLPRTVDELARWVLPIPRKELVPGDLLFFAIDGTRGGKATADHVGIYSGDGGFLHAASSGRPTGVTRASLSEPYWASRYLFSGRIVSASTLSGLAFEFGGAAHLEDPSAASFSGNDLAYRAAAFDAGGFLPLGSNFMAGARIGLGWDSLLGVARIPMELVVGQAEGFSIFAGPAFTIGNPAVGGRSYMAPVEWITTLGLRWSTRPVRWGANSVGLFSEMRFDRYEPDPGQPEVPSADRRAMFSFGIGISYRRIRY